MDGFGHCEIRVRTVIMTRSYSRYDASQYHENDFVCDFGDMVTHVEVGERLKQARKARQMSREALAERMKLSVATIQHNENGTRSLTIETLDDYCRILKVTRDWLVAGIGPMSAGGAADPDTAEVIKFMGTLPDQATKREVVDFAKWKSQQGKTR
jgi:transcriptional regulator with XRE-family HTH domain